MRCNYIITSGLPFLHLVVSSPCLSSHILTSKTNKQTDKLTNKQTRQHLRIIMAMLRLWRSFRSSAFCSILDTFIICFSDFFKSHEWRSNSVCDRCVICMEITIILRNEYIRHSSLPVPPEQSKRDLFIRNNVFGQRTRHLLLAVICPFVWNQPMAVLAPQ